MSRIGMNPIGKREFLARWRDPRSHLLLLALAVALSVAAYWSYHAALEPPPPGTVVGGLYIVAQPVEESLATRASRAGHALFSTLAVGNVAVWFLMAPLLTATSVARERERGLLEGLQLSHMTPRSQVWARAWSAMLYLGALQLVTLPVYFVAFSFGGVSPAEIGRAWLLVGVAAWCGVGLGLMLSAQAHRPSGALFGAIALVFGWSALSFVGFDSLYNPWGLLGLGAWTRPLSQFLAWSHPVTVALRLCEPSLVRPVFLGPGWTLWPFGIVLPTALAVWFTLGSVGLLKAARDVTRAFAPSGWAGRNPFVERWKRRRAEQLELKRARSTAIEGALLADLPLDRWIHFKNPLLNREVKSRFRLRRASTPLWIARGALALFALVGWVQAATMIFDPVDRASGASLVLWVEWILGVALVGTFAASGFAREREAGTWEGVRLSLLSNGQIARTKWASPLIAFALMSCPMWLLLWAFAPWGERGGIPFRVLLAGALVVASSLAFVSALASWVSLRARNTTTATLWTIGILLALFWVLPSAWQGFGVGDTWASKRVGAIPTSGYFSSNYSNYYNSYDPQFVALYKQQTNRSLHLITRRNRRGQIYQEYDSQGLAAYQNWFAQKQKQSSRLAALSGAWNPVLVLNQLDANKNQVERLLTDDDLALLGLSHALLCVLAIALLVASATHRLKGRLD